MFRTPFNDGWITIIEAVQLTDYSAAYLRRWASQGRITAEKKGA